MSADSIRRGHSRATDPRQAVRELHAAVWRPDLSLVVFFCSSSYALDELADEMNRQFPGVTVVGCTTAGEIGPAGYCDNSLAGAGFSHAAGTVVAARLEHLQAFSFSEGEAFAQGLLHRLERAAPAASAGNTFGLLLIDGLSIREEPVVHTLQLALGKIALVGGSAGDDLRLERTLVFHEGAFHADCAVLTLVSTPLPFKVFKTQHFVSENERLVVTEADVAHRIVKEINGLPAAEEYARVIGVPVEELGPLRFAAAPVVVVIDGTDYVRAILKANPDGTLTFYCAIDEGLVLRVARGEDLPGNLAHALDEIRAEIGPPQLLLGYDCILRKLEITQHGQRDDVARLLDDAHAVGFCTYGEQYGGVHVSQTLTGIAIGYPGGRDG